MRIHVGIFVRRGEPLKRPFVFINSAMSADGKISSVERKQVRISGPEDRARVDALRAKSDAIMVGVGTVLADDPALRVRSSSLREARAKRGEPENPLRVVADSRARTPPAAQVLGPGCLIAVSRSAPLNRMAALSHQCEIAIYGEDRVDLLQLMAALNEMGIKRLMVEGGATLNWSMISLGLVDEIYVYIGALILGGENAPTLVDGAGFREEFPLLKLISADQMDGGVLLRWGL
jgi:2,5-diamino-6-(ribosylamino)-4(3H)-pyrimidinone 5'-phosphate reductase